jgi:hypothetical protein
LQLRVKALIVACRIDFGLKKFEHYQRAAADYEPVVGSSNLSGRAISLFKFNTQVSLPTR